MRLTHIRIQGFRRFEEQNARMKEPLIALVGPNEAGKTSVLDALRELSKGGKIKDRDQTRNNDNQTKVSATYRLDEADRKELEPIEWVPEIDECVITKDQDGEFSVELSPPPERTLTRKRLISEINKIGEREPQNSELSINTGLTSKLHSGQGRIDSEILNAVLNIIKTIEKVLESEKLEDEEMWEYTRTRLEDLVEEEKAKPAHDPWKILQRRAPEFLFFGDEERSLNTTYNLPDEGYVSKEPALGNLLELAGVSLAELRKATESGNNPRKAELVKKANEKLRDIYSESWVRDDVVPYIDIQNETLNLYVESSEGITPIDQRSDGFRWYVALLAFLDRTDSNEPILLIDEAETHLSYDAQAQLINVLETQDLAQQVIYSTHSAGCLPSDLGTGIRPVIPKEPERSRISNGFWTEGTGFAPLMLAMGLSPLAFSVARNALIGEGPSETILLPTLLRQANDESKLDYQVAPGASTVSKAEIQKLLSEGGQSAVILDGDGAGEDMKQMLFEEGAAEERVRTYNDLVEKPLRLEDMVDPEEYLNAVNKEIDEYQDTEDRIELEDISEFNRANDVKDWRKERDLGPISKPNVAQRLVDRAQETDIVDEENADGLREVHEWASEHFVKPGTAPGGE
ncbi:ATP-dependent nuclease [Halobium salinum]|nr:AAA family ATPase [Halobium salinum]